MNLQPALGQPLTLKAWVQQWLANQYPIGFPSDMTASQWREEMYADLPSRFQPSLDTLRDLWWVKTVSDLARRLPEPIAFRDTSLALTGSTRLVSFQLTLDLDELFDYEVGKARRIRADALAIQRDVERYVAANPQVVIDTPTFVASILAAAGL